MQKYNWKWRQKNVSSFKEYYADMNAIEVPSGQKVFNWTIQKEWNINAGYIENERGEKIIDFAQITCLLWGILFQLKNGFR